MCVYPRDAGQRLANPEPDRQRHDAGGDRRGVSLPRDRGREPGITLRNLAVGETGRLNRAYAARRAGIPLREMIPLAYAHGLEPRLAGELEGEIRLAVEEAADL